MEFRLPETIVTTSAYRNVRRLAARWGDDVAIVVDRRWVNVRTIVMADTYYGRPVPINGRSLTVDDDL